MEANWSLSPIQENHKVNINVCYGWGENEKKERKSCDYTGHNQKSKYIN